MVTMIIHVLTYSGFNKVQKIWYLLTFAAVMICAGAEFLVHGIPYKASYKIPLTIVTVVQFSIAPLLAILFSGALGLHNQTKAAIVFLSVNLFIEILAAPFGWIFYFSDTKYDRGDLFLIYEIFYFVSLIYLVVNMVIVGRKFRKRDVGTIIMILVIIIAGILPMTFSKVNITYVAIAIGACVCYIYYNDLVQQDVQAELVANQQKISGMQTHMISGLANLIENRDMETGEHILRTSAYVKMLADFSRKDGVYSDVIDDRFIDLMYTLAPMHDIGKIVVSDRILKKPGKLTAEEFELMKRHAAVGGSVVREVLSGITDEEYLTFAANVATYHHEWWNGTGYPKGLKGDEIPLAARIMALADVFDALVSERCYKKAMPPEQAFKIIEEESGTHFDPNLAAVFLAHRAEFEEACRSEITETSE